VSTAKPCRLFAYGTLLPGEREHALLASAELLGQATTEPRFQLVDLGLYAALIADGKVAVHGELYAVSLETRRAIDIARQVPILFQRCAIRLADGSEAEAYMMNADPVRGKRRLAHGDWRKRFAAAVPHRAGGPLVAWARSRFDK
jgi:gamma-glutamylaminecyclotransferase